jgi:hypothetical protein
MEEPSIRQLKNDMNRCRRIDGLSVFLRGFEFDLLSGPHGAFIKPVT